MAKDIKYQLRLWKVRHELDLKGVKQPVSELIKRKLITPDESFTDKLLGRIDDYEFLDKLERLNEALKYE